VGEEESFFDERLRWKRAYLKMRGIFLVFASDDLRDGDELSCDAKNNEALPVAGLTLLCPPWQPSYVEA
jgi:hypothetical protein